MRNQTVLWLLVGLFAAPITLSAEPGFLSDSSELDADMRFANSVFSPHDQAWVTANLGYQIWYASMYPGLSGFSASCVVPEEFWKLGYTYTQGRSIEGLRQEPMPIALPNRLAVVGLDFVLHQHCPSGKK